MKPCPYCSQGNQDQAVLCAHCGKLITRQEQRPWYFKISTLVIALLCVGPLALPLLWFNPHFKRIHKFLISIAVIVFSYALGILLVRSIKALAAYYGEIAEMGIY